MNSVIRQRVTVHTLDNRSIEGVLIGVYRDAFALAHATYLQENGPGEQLDGETLIPARNVAFVQAPLAAER